jgi:hypothetical protein
MITQAMMKKYGEIYKTAVRAINGLAISYS